MKKIISIFMLIALVLTMCSCKRSAVMTDGKLTTEVTLYFSNAEYNDMYAEKRMVSYDEEDKFSEAVVKELIKGPTDTNGKSVIPSGTKLLSISRDGTVTKINFSGEYLNFKGEHSKSVQLLARYSLVKTLCSLEGIEKIHILVEGKDLLSASGTPIGPIGEDDIVLSHNFDNVTEKYVTVYFSNDNGELVARRRKVPVEDNSIEKAIVSELIKGPGDEKGVYGTMPSGTEVISVETKEEMCFVNLSGEFISNFSGGSTEAETAIYSVVNSLTELPDITKVQFLVDNEKVDTFGDYVFSEPFVRDDTLIKE